MKHGEKFWKSSFLASSKVESPLCKMLQKELEGEKKMSFSLLGLCQWLVHSQPWWSRKGEKMELLWFLYQVTTYISTVRHSKLELREGNAFKKLEERKRAWVESRKACLYDIGSSSTGREMGSSMDWRHWALRKGKKEKNRRAYKKGGRKVVRTHRDELRLLGNMIRGWKDSDSWESSSKMIGLGTVRM